MTTLLASCYPQLGSLPLTAEFDDGTWIVCEQIRGWDGSPPTTLTPRQRTRQNGTWAGVTYLTGRPLILDGWMFAPNETALTELERTLNEAVALTDFTLTVVEGATTRTMQVRRGGEVDIRKEPSGVSAQWSISLYANDPRKFLTTLQGSTGLPATSGGLTVPFTVPFTLDAVVVAGQISLTNPGNAIGKVVARIDGPVTDPTIRHIAGGVDKLLAFDLAISATDYLLIDMEARTAYLNGTASRNGYITDREWSGFNPGVNTWQFNAASYDTGTLTITAYPADL